MSFFKSANSSDSFKSRVSSSKASSQFSSHFSSSDFTVDSLLDFIYSSSLLKDESVHFILDGKHFNGFITVSKEKGLKKPFIISLSSSD